VTEPYAQPPFTRRLRDHVREQGIARVASRMARWAAAAAVPRGGEFELGGEPYRLLRRAHERTWVTERAVEVPVARRLLEGHRGERVLEVGNVLSHYMPIAHEVVDKYERAPGVRNVDVLDLPGGAEYDLVIAISTLEHVGRDETPRESVRAVHALEHLRGLLRPGGTLFATVPVGYNQELDAALAEGPYELRAMRRAPWREIDPAEAFECPYDFLVYRATAVLFVMADSLRSS
jgi:SAM-dependent methyltransferase